ncbi:MAG: cell filamentation protein Fic [Ignavibacteria bacterium RIFOXYB2_FULL_35_12]|nr:MAG: cell filamentation protein Fic [Ignavibacteria bacterium GWC2_35_8]OGU60458.1 MAG: cell filamentation protein Fic [Ignavibacteria bacterium GWF2_35_20]OGU84570.1 MAG: cell filamentation protein Fic [Ignavibacteria bacterium RIFOXYA12_FULL_35_25]OGU96840.1 MAG: cell filamentation protein Fic [Ignavibacteria bacterium RIFOXYB12_FULL_35_14]OGV01322.1 MAG: cell filamentation protein Fic [Ignavibacteria bacterium RIFOXYC2_FULL_35_16]OGV05234.1 MAG: cell filamentation protein Fic [Ignavibact
MSELIFSSMDRQENYKISKMLQEKKIRKIAPRIYSTNLEEAPSAIVKRNILEILGNLYPEAVLSHRSAFEFKPTATNKLFVTYTYTKKIKLPGITINFLEGKGPVAGDNKMIGELYVASEPRRFLENLQITKKTGHDSKTLSIPQIEEKLDDILRIKGEEGLNSLRDKARDLSKILDMQKEYELLNKIMGALFTTKPSKILKSDLALSRSVGLPYDRHRIEIFEILFNYLHNKVFQEYPENNLTPNSFGNFAFFESYFSNYIEGTVFEVSEAKEIIDTGIPLPARSGDSHDILGTYRLVSNRNEMKIIPSDENEFLKILQSRHKTLLSARTDKHPGEFKLKNNRAGDTHFVEVKLVRGTLIRGFDYYKILTDPFARTAYMMFLVSEVHPFEDGNGRIARVMMNAELVNRNQCKIIIPTVYREDYLRTLKKLTRDKDPVPYVEMLSKAHEFSSYLNNEDYDKMYKYLATHNAFSEPDEGKHLIID